ncbi:probable serine/threonine-protein kinase PBL25 [Salvia hispanica]|uniref:probable serine/threonine-protein kinase PBL25 n=1 Tax=Salvia hispanica TaxID=49212 RepID=UPI0020096B69|nr:probable serine/threonine-protein kinase PBL25 [Salvia hispanica]
MSCFPCFQNKDDDDEEDTKNIPVAQPKNFSPRANPPVTNSQDFKDPFEDSRNDVELEEDNSTVKSFTFREIATATKNFRQECLLGEGGFGKVFKGTIQSGEVVAVRQLERNTGGKDFVFDISNLSLLRHPNLVKMVGYCGEGEQRHMVYEYMPSGSLKSFLFDRHDGQKPLNWSERMKIAYGIAAGLEYLHEKADPVVIYRDLRSSNVLLTDTMSPKLSDYGLAKIVAGDNKMHMSVMTGFNGYCAPEFEKNGELTIKSDVYSFGVVMLELITGRKALDTSLPQEEQSLVSWAHPLFKDPSKYPDMADPLLRKGFPVTGLNQAIGMAAMCLQEEPIARPLISDISAAISFLAMAPPQAPLPEDEPAPAPSKAGGEGHKHEDSSSESEEESDEEEEEQKQPEPIKHEQSDYSSDEDYSGSEAEEAKPKVEKIKSRSETKSNNKKPGKVESRRSYSSSDDDELPLPLPIQQYPKYDLNLDLDQFSSSSDDENWDGGDDDVPHINELQRPTRGGSIDEGH